ncbi:uncharacterized protein UTRI_02792 [Ustilago trichophora]|uniref:Uncharacterized protein n=1 Tax=Ustilago trichophora TaxID=86804 RepID=A0A5C3EQE7_9BASI|nr:uncharacterized protein UTRI_02792 [Ustilago trichophora]
MMQIERIRAGNLPPRAESSASSYHTTLDRFATPTDSVESLASSSPSLSHEQDDQASSPPSSPELEYEIIKRRREGTALVIQHPTLVNFVPTSDIQTAVRVLPDCVVIDTILPPTATLRASDLARRPPQTELQRIEGQKPAKFDAAELLEKHKAELYQTLTTKLTENYDPTGSIKEEIFTTLTQLTRFPDPKGTNKSQYTEGQCPCICCEMGCSNPLEPYSASTQTTSIGTSNISSPTLSTTHTRSASAQPLYSFLEMTEAPSTRPDSMGGIKGGAGRSKNRFGFLSFGRFGRSRSQMDLASSTGSKSKHISMTGLPVPAPALPETVTGQVVPPRSVPSLSRSFSDLVRRRRKKHMAGALGEASPAIPPATSSMAQGDLKASKSLDVETLHLPTRSSSQTNLASSSRIAAAPGRYSLDSARVDTPFEGPKPPPRRSSKMYAIVSRKPVPQLNASSSTGSLDRNGSRTLPATIPRSGRSAYGIGQIVEEDEGFDDRMLYSDAGRNNVSLSRRQSALISDFEPLSNGSLYENHPADASSSELRSNGDVNIAQRWGFRSIRTDRSVDPNIPATAKPLGIGEETQIGVAI